MVQRSGSKKMGRKAQPAAFILFPVLPLRGGCRLIAPRGKAQIGPGHPTRRLPRLVDEQLRVYLILAILVYQSGCHPLVRMARGELPIGAPGISVVVILARHPPGALRGCQRTEVGTPGFLVVFRPGCLLSFLLVTLLRNIQDLLAEAIFSRDSHVLSLSSNA